MSFMEKVRGLVMIEMKELVNRRYLGTDLIQFEYVVEKLPGPQGTETSQRIWFERINPQDYMIASNGPAYIAKTILGNHVYQTVFGTPKPGMPITLVAAMGLNYLKEEILNEINFKEVLCYTISDITRNM